MCHDLDAFSCLLDGSQSQRSLPFRIMTRHILRGLQRAARVVCVSSAVRSQLTGHNLIPEQATAVASLGVHPSCTPSPNLNADRRAVELLPDRGSQTINILHVGSTIQRKRID